MSMVNPGNSHLRTGAAKPYVVQLALAAIELPEIADVGQEAFWTNYRCTDFPIIPRSRPRGPFLKFLSSSASSGVVFFFFWWWGGGGREGKSGSSGVLIAFG